MDLRQCCARITLPVGDMLLPANAAHIPHVLLNQVLSRDSLLQESYGRISVSVGLPAAQLFQRLLTNVSSSSYCCTFSIPHWQLHCVLSLSGSIPVSHLETPKSSGGKILMESKIFLYFLWDVSFLFILLLLSFLLKSLGFEPCERHIWSVVVGYWSRLCGGCLLTESESPGGSISLPALFKAPHPFTSLNSMHSPSSPLFISTQCTAFPGLSHMHALRQSVFNFPPSHSSIHVCCFLNPTTHQVKWWLST